MNIFFRQSVKAKFYVLPWVFLISGSPLLASNDGGPYAVNSESTAVPANEETIEPPPLSPPEIETTEPFSRLAVSTGFSYSKIDAINLENGAPATLHSNINLELRGYWYQVWTSYFRTFAKVGVTRMDWKPNPTSDAPIDNPTLLLTGIGIGAEGVVEPFEFGASANYEQQLFYRPDEALTGISLESISIPTFQFWGQLTVVEILPYSIFLRFRESVFTSTANDFYSTNAATGWEISAGLRRQLSWGQASITSFYRKSQLDSSIFSLRRDSVGLTIGVTWSGEKLP